MPDIYIISKMNKYMFRINAKIVGCHQLSKIIDNWWQEQDLSNLSQMERTRLLIVKS